MVSPGRKSGRVLTSSQTRSWPGRSMPITCRAAVPLANEMPAGVSASVSGAPSSLTEIQSVRGLCTKSASLPASALAESLSSSRPPSA
jgi:hypothetical protein